MAPASTFRRPWASSAPPGKAGGTTRNLARACGAAPTTGSTAGLTVTTRCSRAWRTSRCTASLEIANQLAVLAGRVRGICVEAQRRFPSNGLDIPGNLSGVHRALSKAGNSLAMTAEAAAMLRLAVGPVPVGRGVGRRRAETVLEQVADAERRLAEVLIGAGIPPGRRKYSPRRPVPRLA